MDNSESALLNKIKQDFPPLHAQAVRWAFSCEAEILRTGTALTPDECALARKAGVSQPERVRIKLIDQIPAPDNELLQAAAIEAGLSGPGAIAMTFGHGIWMTAKACPDSLLHELYHVRQYERLGGIQNFIALYMAQIIAHGHEHAPLEVESRTFVSSQTS